MDTHQHRCTALVFVCAGALGCAPAPLGSDGASEFRADDTLCDPLLPECAPDESCQPTEAGHFICHPLSSRPGRAFDACEPFDTTCLPGLACVAAEMFPTACSQAAGSCCAPLCDLNELPTSLESPSTCSARAPYCIPWYADAGQTPPGFEDLGVCVEDPDPGACAIWDDDCPAGEKCMPWASDGSTSFDATTCSPIQPDPDGLGDPCVAYGGATSGVDSCGDGSMCYYVDAETQMGACVPLCGGSPTNTICDSPSDVCTIAYGGVLTLCLPECDPVLQDCAEGSVCVQARAGGPFACMNSITEGAEQPGDPCEHENSCRAGLSCEAADLVPDCESERCCTPFCDFEDPSTACPPGGQECQSVYPPGEAPPGLEHVGLCRLPS